MGANVEFSNVIAFSRRYTALIIGVTVSAAVVAVLCSFLITPVYRVATTLSPVGSNQDSNGVAAALASQFGGFAQALGISLNQSGNEKDVALAVLQSYDFLAAFIKANNILPKLFPKQWDASRNAWAKNLSRPHPTMWDGVKRLRTKVLEVGEDARTGIVTVSMTWPDAAAAADWVNELISRLNEQMRAMAITQATQSTKYLKKEMAGADIVEVRQAIATLLQQQYEQIMIARVRRGYAFRVIQPAVAPAPNDVAWPKRKVLAFVGAVAGLALGYILALILDVRRSARQPE